MIRILVLLIVLGLVAWLVTYLPLPAPFPQLIWVCMVLVLIWELLALAGYTKSLINRPGPP